MLKSDMTMHGISMDHAWDRMGPQYGQTQQLSAEARGAHEMSIQNEMLVSQVNLKPETQAQLNQLSTPTKQRCYDLEAMFLQFKHLRFKALTAQLMTKWWHVRGKIK